MASVVTSILHNVQHKFLHNHNQSSNADLCAYVYIHATNKVQHQAFYIAVAREPVVEIKF